MENRQDMQDAKLPPKRAVSATRAKRPSTTALTASTASSGGGSARGAITPSLARGARSSSSAALARKNAPRSPALKEDPAQAALFAVEARKPLESTPTGEPEDIGSDPMEGLQQPAADEPLVAICRQYLTVGLPVNEVLKAFLRDRTIIRICHRQAYNYRLSEADAAELLHELGILFYRKLLPRLREPEKLWSVCALTAKRLASGMCARIREVSLEDLGGGADTGGRFEVDDRATKAADALLHDSLESNSHEAAVVSRIDKEKAISELAALLQLAPAPVAARDKSAEDDLRRSITFGPPGVSDPRLCDPLRTSPLIDTLFDPTKVLPMPPDDQPVHVPGMERMPRTYGAVLIKVRDELGMTQKDLAEVLGISESSCAQYMACAHGMPRDIWEEVLELQEQGAPRRRRLRQLFDNVEIRDILTNWMKRVQQREPERPVTLVDIARIVNVNKSTVSRWAKNEQRPTLDRLGELEDGIQAWLNAKRPAPATRRR